MIVLLLAPSENQALPVLEEVLCVAVVVDKAREVVEPRL